MTATVRVFTIFLVALLYGLTGAPRAEAQVWKKLKKATQQASQALEELDGAIRCRLNDKECLDKAQSEGRPAVLTDEKGNVIKDENGTPTVILPDDNQFAEGTTIERFGTVETRGAEYKISPDGAHAAVPGLQGSRQTVFVNGKPDLVLDRVFFPTFRFSSTGGHYAYVGRSGSACVVVVDGKETDTIPCEQQEVSRASNGSDKSPLFFFSRDGSHLAYRKQTFVERKGRGGQITRHPAGHVVVIDGTPGPLIGMGHRPRLFVRGEHVFYQAEKPRRAQNADDVGRVYVNHTPGPAYAAVRGLVVSEDGTHYAYIAATQKKGKERVVINGKPGPVYPQIGRLYMEGRTGTVFYSAVVGHDSSEGMRTWKYVVGNYSYNSSDAGFLVSPRPSHRALRAFDHTSATVLNALGEVDQNMHLPRTLDVVVSPNGKRHAFVAQTSTRRAQEAQRVWANGKKSLDYEEITELRFTGDSNRLVFIAHTGGKAFVVVEDTELGPFDRARNLQVSEAGGAYAFIAEDDQGARWYVNGTPVGAADNAKDFAFSPDGSRYAFGASTSTRNRVVVVDGEEREERLAEFLSSAEPNREKNKFENRYTAPSLLFSPKGNRLAYIIRAMQNGQMTKNVLLVDATPVPHNGQGNATYSFPTFSPDGEHFAYLHSKQQDRKRRWQLYIDGKPGPVVGEQIPGTPGAVSFVDDRTVRTIGFLENEIVKHTISF